MADIINILNTIRANGSQMYQDRVPVATKENLTSVSAPLMEYSVLQNEFLNALVNRIGLTLIRNKTADNPLKILKQGSVPLGQDVQEIHTNPATAKTYNAQSTDLLAQTTPDVASAYHRLNRKDRYDVTIQREQLHTAFTDWGKFEELITGIVNTLYSGNYIDEFILAKNLFASAISDNKIVTATANAPTDEATAKKLVKQMRQLFNNFSFPSSAFNSYALSGGTGSPRMTWTPPEDIRLIIRSDVEAEIDVEVLAKAFHLDYAKLLGQILVVDNFGSAENCMAVMMDKSYTQIYDNLFETAEFPNGSNLSWNYYLHVWQTYSVSPFANAVAILEA